MQAIGRIPNPRRVTAENSVCVRKSPSQIASSNISVVSNVAANGEDFSIYHGREASQAAESAKTWFEDSNKNVSSERASKFYADNDPPFFLRHKSSSDESLPNPHKAAPTTSATFLKRFPKDASFISRNQTHESSSEDFRGVIDDLTIENRKLRKKLRRYQQVHCGDLQGDKLFEIRIHGLPASKKRKLEKTLQEFASSLGDDPEDEQMKSAFAQKLAKVPKRNPGLHHNASSSGTSNSRTFGDSAYASMSNYSNPHASKVESSRVAIGAPANDQAVRSYLHNLSRGLLPKHPPVLTEQTKKQVVVQRLEQLFTGSQDVSGKDSQSKQQQEVSQSAASADRKTAEGEGYRVSAEGRRESRIFTTEDDPKHGARLSTLDRADTESSGTLSIAPNTPDQRPTRPLDLDPSRAQVPEDNIEYMKHLGFEAQLRQVDKKLSEDEGWIYLNLLTGMAQLHILNVTPEFVRNAIREISNQLELSSDNARIRWKGGKRPTLVSVDSGDVSTHSSNYSLDITGPQINNSTSSKSLELQSGSGSGNNRSSHEPASNFNAFDRYRPMSLDQPDHADSHQYRPLFYHDNRSSDGGGHSYNDDDKSSLSSGALESSKLGPDGANRAGNTVKTVSRSRLRKGVDPIIFYNKARFYTDLSKDDESMPYNCPLYTKNVKSVIGMAVTSNEPGQEEKGPLSKAMADLSVLKLDHNESYPTIHGLTKGTQTFQVGKGSEPTKLISFEASGIGGVVPGDNFSIDVEVELQHQNTGKKIATMVISAKTIEMLPSQLPPPSYAFLPFSSSSESDDEDSDSDADMDMDMDMVDEDVYEQDIKSYIPPKFLNSFSSSGNSENADEDDMSDDSSIDMLAHARELEPETVAAAEREFDDNITSSDEDDCRDVAPTASSVVATLGDQSFEKDVTREKTDPGSSRQALISNKTSSAKKAPLVKTKIG